MVTLYSCTIVYDCDASNFKPVVRHEYSSWKGLINTLSYNIPMNANENNLERFLDAHTKMYGQAIHELRMGKKRSHWMWYIFPQISGLGRSGTAKFYAIENIIEAQEYLNHPVLGARLFECTEAVLDIEEPNISKVLSSPDDMKLKSSMTLFSSISPSGNVFTQVLNKYFNGDHDNNTLRLLSN